MMHALFLIFLACIEDNSATLWKRDTTRENKIAETYVGSPLTVRSLSECIIFCEPLDHGAAVFYNENDNKKTCKCSFTQTRPLNTLTSEAGTIHFVKQICEVDGYKEIMDNFCLKTFETALPYDQANEHCSTENGRLVRLDTDQKTNKSRDYLKKVTVSNNMVYYIDGKKSDTWRFSDGSEISTFQWAWGEPNWDHCLSLFTDEFLHGDTTCLGYVTGYNFGFICERLN